MAQYHFPLSLLFCLCRHLTLSILPGGRSELQGMAEDSSETGHLSLPIQTMFPFCASSEDAFYCCFESCFEFYRSNTAIFGRHDIDL